ncbi:antitoxin Xre/MbcA/ParS toxin-binding domain-containing protein [Halomonas sp. HNIBRBA4712]|uniref:antitoxin Xre/MbcA/ParS toxin-binding domain-containing protein n=1 Tax=Halomonas sp. HNIBRBA4712 TaxID=3373087 RepID=UPI003747147F
MATAVMDVEARVAMLIGARSGVKSDELIRKGIPLSALERLAQHGVDVARLGIIKPRTLTHRRSKGEALSPEEGDRLYRASKIVLLAEEVIGSRAKAHRWLNKPRKALGNVNALQAIMTTPGYMAAEELLEQLRHGYVL